MEEKLLQRNAMSEVQKTDVDLYKKIWIKEGRNAVWKIIGRVGILIIIMEVVIGMFSMEVDKLRGMVYAYPLMTLIPLAGFGICMQISARQIGKQPDENFSRGLIYVVKNDVKNHYVIYKYAVNDEIQETKWRYYKISGKILENEYATMICEKESNERLFCEDTSWKNEFYT